MPIFAPHKMYRTDYTRCVSSDPETQCPEHAIQVYENATEPQRRYWLGFIEFDDQGQLFDRRQMEAVLEDLARQPGELLIVVFVHGWKHSAAPGDDNIAGFRQALGDLAEMEAVGSENPRQVAGIYIGWRGESITVPVIKELTFWDRKNTSHKVGNGGVTEVFNRIDLIRRMKNGTAENQAGPTRLAIVGHSFGGAVVFSAVDEILSDRFIASLRASEQPVRGFGDLVILINPAFEALRYTPLSDMATETDKIDARSKTYPSGQLPVLAVLTSEADYATRYAFRVGRLLSTLFEKVRDMRRHNRVTGQTEIISQKQANVTALGHFEPYRTHTLQLQNEESPVMSSSCEQQVRLFVETTRPGWENDHPGHAISFGDVILTRTERSAGRNPYLTIRVDKRLIPNHNDIDDPRIARFLRQLIMLSSR